MIGLWYVIRKVLDRMNAMVMGMLRMILGYRRVRFILPFNAFFVS